LLLRMPSGTRTLASNYSKRFALFFKAFSMVKPTTGLPDLLFVKGPNLVQKSVKKSQILRQGAKKEANLFFQISSYKVI